MYAQPTRTKAAAWWRRRISRFAASHSAEPQEATIAGRVVGQAPYEWSHPPEQMP
jgi:hypothetical protein